MDAHPLTVPRERMTPGCTTTSWCYECKQQTDHRYQPGHMRPLVCLECEERNVNQT